MSKNTKLSHPEWRKENSLTSPEDRDKEQKWRPDQSDLVLTNNEAEEAMKALNNTSFTDRFPQVERRYVDPPINLQNIGLFSFVPAKGAQPNEKGVYGFAKLRGNYATPIEASERAEYIIRNVDSYHQVYHTYVGRPFPVTISSNYSKEVNQVDLRKEMTENISSDVKKKREKEQKDIEEIQKREKELLERNEKILRDPEQKEPQDPELELDTYITLRVKKAQLTWTYVETKRKMEEMVGIIAKTRAELEDMEESNSEHKKTYLEKYTEARRRSGLDTATHQDNFIKFMIEDYNIPEVTAEYEKIKNKEQKTD